MTWIDRVWAKVDKSAGANACWLWMGTLNTRGYGVAYVRWLREENRSQMVLAHRAVWVLSDREIPDGTELCHTCDNKRCVNPAHLYAGTHAQNMADASRAGVMHRDNRGDRNPARRLSAAQVVEIRARYQPHYGALTELARQYGVHPSTIRLAVLGHTWKEFAA